MKVGIPAFGDVRLGLPDFMLKWNFLKTLIISGIIFGAGFFFGFVSPKLFKSMVKSVSDLVQFFFFFL